MKMLCTFLLCAIVLALPGAAGISRAQTCATDEACTETGLFTSVAPEAMIVLDMSGSMKWNPPGDIFHCPNGLSTCYYNPANGSCAAIWNNPAFYNDYRTSYVPPYTTNCGNSVLKRYSNATCSGPFYQTSTEMPGYGTDCARYLIAREVIKKLLDDNKDGKIFTDDDTSLNIRMGFAKFQGAYYQEWKPIGTSYRNIYCGAPFGSLTYCTTPTSYNIADIKCILRSMMTDASVGGATPLALALESVKTTMDAKKDADTYKNCRQRFVILLSDGADTMYCGDAVNDTDRTQYKRRRASVARAKALADAGYKLFVVGFGSNMPDIEKNTLNWMAYYGGTDNPLVTNSGDKTALDASAFAADPCVVSATTGTCDDTSTQCFAASNDPGNTPLNGYAFIAGNATELEAGLREAINYIREANYAFSQSSVASSRIADENYLYEVSFQPVNNDPMWLGHLRKYQILSDGTVGGAIWDAGQLLQARDPAARVMKTFKGGALVDFTTANLTYTDLGVENDTRRNEVVGYVRGESAQINNDGTIGAALWDGGQVLQGTDAAARSIYTYKSGALTAFTTTNITAANLGVSTTTRRNEVVGFIRGESTYNKDNWKLGDTFRSNPVTVGTPSAYFKDARDSAGAFSTFRTNNLRTTANGKRVVVAGANDGQLHAFRTDTGGEVWSFIPPNVLTKLKDIAHKSHPTGLTHQYFVDGPISVADVWVGTGDGTTKSAADWKTLMIFGEGRGGTSTLWSSSASCDSGFQNVYSATYSNYCGYYALDITNTTSPVYRWRIGPSAAQSPYLGDPWSKMMVHRVKVSGNEKWVGFVGGGNNLSSCSVAGCDLRGKGFFVVNLTDGSVLWSYTKADNSSMNYALPGTAAIVDSDNDGFVDLAYIGDLGGNIWRMKFCSAADGSSCATGNWSGSLLFAREAGIGAVYDAPAVAKDAGGNIWVYWGTGDKAEPIVVGTVTDRFYAVKDATKSGSYQLSNLEDITSSTYTDNASKHGWTMNLTGAGEKCLSEASVFAGIVYFTTYTPAGSGGDPCDQAGSAKLYALSFIEGAGSLTGNARSMTLGVGIPTAPVLSMNPYSKTPDLYVTVSGGAGTGATTMRANVNPPSIANRTNLIHWRDRRFQ